MRARFHILLIEDSEAEAKLFEAALREAAPRVTLYWVATAAEAIEYLNQENRFAGMGPVHMILCDLNLPTMSGFEFLKKIKGQLGTPIQPTPIILYSSSSDPRDVRQSYALGANAYLVKPMTIETTVQQLKSLIHFWFESAKLPSYDIWD
ncbi:MAG TPA: response regulator [Bryobacteraceae bacterium]|nr:response regulator [Bryobacteraceae bacterium]